MSAAALPRPAAPATPARAARLRTAALALAAASALLAAAGLVFAALNARTPLPTGTNWRAADAGALAFLACGALLAAQRPANPLSWVALVIGALNTAALLGGEYAVWALLTEPGAPGGAWAQWVVGWAWLPAYLLVPTLLLLLFPDGRPPSRRWAPLVPVTLVAIAAATVEWATTPYGELGEPVFDPATANPVAGAGLPAPLDLLPWLVVPCIVLCVASVVVRLRRAEGLERQQLRWFGAGVAATLVVLAAGQTAGEALAPVALGLALVLLPGSVAVAVLRHGLWRLGPVARRSVVYGALSASVLAVYGIAALVLGGGEVVATAVVALALLPARERLERGVNRLLYGDRDEPWAAVRRLGERLAAPATTADAAREVGRALRLPRVAVLDPGAPAGDAPGDEVQVPLVFHGEPVGTLVAGGRELGAADRAALAELAPHLAAAVHAVRLTDEVRRSRERLVAAREEERRRLRADLHDELGPSLAMLALRLDAARDLAAGPEGEAVLRDLAAQARDGLGQVRSIVRDLRPAVLDDLGLAAALDEQVAALRDAGLDARLEVRAPLGPLPAAVEVAAYRIAREALSNVVRHARAGACTVTLVREADALRVEVRDDGRGLPDPVRPGVGLGSMAARADELGGACAAGPAPGGGTRVVATLPLAR